MLSSENVASIEVDGRRLSQAARRSPSRQVPQYPDWTLTDLARHTASIHARTVAICRDLPRERIAAPPLPDGMSPLDWYDETLEEMLKALIDADPATPVWALGANSKLGFWESRMVVETGVHSWDASQAIGDTHSLTDHVARSGLDEYAGLYLPQLGEPQTLEVVTEDLGIWVFGEGAPTGKVTGTASDAYLALVSRPAPVLLPDDWATAIHGLAPPPKP